MFLIGGPVKVPVGGVPWGWCLSSGGLLEGTSNWSVGDAEGYNVLVSAAQFQPARIRHNAEFEV